MAISESFPDLLESGYLEPDNLILQQTSRAGRHGFSMMASITTAATLNSSVCLHEESGERKSKKTRKARTAFSDYQLNELERTFERQKYLSVQDRMQLAEKLNLSDMQVKTWYQNRRTKWKRQASVGMELLTEATNNVNQFFQQQQRMADDSGMCRRGDLLEPLSALMMRAKHLPLLSSDLFTLFSAPPTSSTTISSTRPLDLDLFECLPFPPLPNPLLKIPTKAIACLQNSCDYFTSR